MRPCLFNTPEPGKCFGAPACSAHTQEGAWEGARVERHSSCAESAPRTLVSSAGSAVCQHWVQHAERSVGEGGPDFRAMNKSALRSGVITSAEACAYRRLHPLRLRVGRGVPGAVRQAPARPTSDAAASFAYGLPSSHRSLEQIRLAGCAGPQTLLCGCATSLWCSAHAPQQCSGERLVRAQPGRAQHRHAAGWRLCERLAACLLERQGQASADGTQQPRSSCLTELARLMEQALPPSASRNRALQLCMLHANASKVCCGWCLVGQRALCSAVKGLHITRAARKGCDYPVRSPCKSR